MSQKIPEEELLNSASYLRLKKIQGAGAIGSLMFLISLVVIFDILSAVAPEFMGSPVFPGTVYSVGVVLAFVIIFLIVVVAITYLRILSNAHQEVDQSLDK